MHILTFPFKKIFDLLLLFVVITICIDLLLLFVVAHSNFNEKNSIIIVCSGTQQIIFSFLWNPKSDLIQPFSQKDIQTHLKNLIFYGFRFFNWFAVFIGIGFYLSTPYI
jgi:hypothetical protein